MNADDVVAERRLEAVSPDGVRTPVVVSVGRPGPDPLSAHDDWRCPFRVTGLGDEVVGAAFGVDSLQALLLAVHKVRLELAARAGAESVALDWLGHPELGLTVEPHLPNPR
ncbi:hypothetical protein AB0G02_11045 [Actinosynnema sp. NPDC023658]|uniref:DUF6968 family protein n=1 Tax=Actinosynnema sp. NPDC023658 TaxID=3155465 RepID=UPI0033D96D12